MRTLIVVCVLLAAAQTAAAQSADRYRGGWRTDDSDPHTYEFSIRGERVRGIYCTLCSDATTLAFIDGTLGADGLTFVVTHVRPDGRTAYQDKASARIEGDRLDRHRHERSAAWRQVPTHVVSGCARARSAARSRAMAAGCHGKAGGACGPRPSRRRTRTRCRRASVGPGRPAGPPAGPPPAGRGWLQPGPWKNPLTLDDVVGAWIGFGTGVNKQYFIFRRVGNGLRGMVCGRCDNPFTLAALDDIEIRGDTLRFKILHDGWGDAPVLPFDKWVTARIVANEMRAVFETPAEAGGRGVTGTPPSGGAGTTLIGPVAIEATAGNDSRPNR